MKRKKFLAAILAVAMIFTSIQLPPMQVSAEEITPTASKIDRTILYNNARSNSWSPEHATEGKPQYAFDDSDDTMYHSNCEGNYNADNVDGSTNTNTIWIQTGFDEEVADGVNDVYYISSIEYKGRTNLLDNMIKDYTVSIANSTKSKEELKEEDFWVVKTGSNEEPTSYQGYTIDLGKAYPATHVRITVTSVLGDDDGYVVARDISISGYKDETDVDKSELFNVIKAAKNVNPDTYCDATAFNTALEAAEAAYVAYNTNQDAVDAAAATLFDIITTLREFNPARLFDNAKANSQQFPVPSWGGDGPANWAFDDPALDTWWHSRYQDWETSEDELQGSSKEDGHASNDRKIWIQTGFDEKWYVDHIEYTGRPNRNALINTYEIYIANEEDPTTDNPVFGDKPIKTGNLAITADTQQIILDEVVEATHIRIVATDAYNGWDTDGTDLGSGHVAAKNISIFGYDLPAADKTELVSAIENVQAKLGSEEANTYNDEYVEDLRAALAEATKINDDPNTFQRVVDAAKDTLLDLINNPIYKITLREFNSAILAKNAMANSEQNPYRNDDGPASWAFDDQNHWWHSRHAGDPQDHEVQSGVPTKDNKIWIQTGFDERWNVSYIEYTPRGSWYNQIGDYEVSILDLEDPKQEPADDAEWLTIKTGKLERSNDSQKIELGKVVKATHIRITALSTISDGSNHITAKKISVFGYDELPDIEVSRNELYDVIAEAEALYNEADRLSDEDGIDPAHIDATRVAAFEAVKSAADAGKAVVEDADADEIARQKEAILNAMNALRAIYLDNSEAKLDGNSLTLNGTIDVNFYMTISEEVCNAEGAYLNFTIDRDGTENDQTWRELLAGKTSAEGKPSNVYLFNVGMPIKDMDTEIKVQIIIPGKEATEDTEAIAERKGLVYTYSVADYITDATTNPGGILGAGASEEAIAEFTNLVNAMSDFGDFATAYFKNGDAEIDDEMLDKIAGVTVGTLETDYAPAVGDIPAKTIYYGSSLLLKADTELRHYFNEQVVEVEVKIGETPVTPDRYAIKQKEGTSKWYLEYTGIGAHELGDAITVTVKTIDDATPVTIVYSPLTYAYIALANENGDTKNLADLMRAMYLYHVAADDYKDPNN